MSQPATLMSSSLLASLTIESGPLGQERAYKLPWRSGGRGIKSLNAMVKVLVSSESANLRMRLELWHGPDGSGGMIHTTPVATSNPGTPVCYTGGDADSTKVLAEYRMYVLYISDSGAPSGARQWAQIELYETVKPF